MRNTGGIQKLRNTWQTRQVPHGAEQLQKNQEITTLSQYGTTQKYRQKSRSKTSHKEKDGELTQMQRGDTKMGRMDTSDFFTKSRTREGRNRTYNRDRMENGQQTR